MHPAVAAVRRSLHYVLLVCRVRHSGRLRSLVAGRGRSGFSWTGAVALQEEPAARSTEPGAALTSQEVEL